MEPDPGQVIRQQAETIRRQARTIRRQEETIRRQEQIIARQQARIAELEQRVARLTARVEDLSALAARLPEEPRLNVDETGHKENGRGLWTWCFRAEPYTLFRIDPSRGSQVLVDLLGREFAGVLGCDYFSAYRKYMGDFDVLVQFCLAHLIRDVKFLTTLPDRVTAAYGRRLLAALRRLFQVIHRQERMDAVRFQRTLERARDQVLAVGQRAPPRAEARNLAERAIRFVVQDRHVTQGTRSERGRRWCERIWTATATCAQQDRSVFQYLPQTLVAHFASIPTPSLLPAGP
jgi:transposase